MDTQDALRSLPAVDAVLNAQAAAPLIARHGRTAVAAAVRESLAAARREIREGRRAETGVAGVVVAAGGVLAAQQRPRLRRTVNATGIILHTGLGRACMPADVGAALAERIGFCNVQMNLATGERMQREEAVKEIVRNLTGAEDAVLVNNNAGATLLVLRALAEGREVVVSRGELIEIGGSFRLPDIMEQSGALLREVGATNKTHPRDYEQAINERTALLMKAHKSNYCVVGFTRETSIADIAAIGRKRGIPVVDDLGCGAMVTLTDFGLGHEMTVRESLEAGADVALFSTDKLIGGPQGGLIVGRADLLRTIRSHPLYRALRVDKLTLTALETTLRLFQSPERLREEHPVYRMMAETPAAMAARAESLAGALGAEHPDWSVTVEDDRSYLGGGSLPADSLPGVAVCLSLPGRGAQAVARALREADPPVVPHIRDDRVLLNMRTVSARECDDILTACRTL